MQTPKCGIFEITGSCFLTLVSTVWKGNGVSARQEALLIILDSEVTGSFPCVAHGCSSEANTFFDSLSTLTGFAVLQSIIIWTQMYIMSHQKNPRDCFLINLHSNGQTVRRAKLELFSAKFWVITTNVYRLTWWPTLKAPSGCNIFKALPNCSRQN